MALSTFTTEQKVEAMKEVVGLLREMGLRSGDRHTFLTVKAVLADVQARTGARRSGDLSELEIALQAVKDSQFDGNYNHGKLLNLAYLVINKWPAISQALEQFGEEIS